MIPWISIIMISFWFSGNRLPCALGVSSVTPNFYGMHLEANLSTNSTNLLISIGWRLTWSTQSQPPNEKLNLLCDVYGNCPSGPSALTLMPLTAYCTMTGTSYDGTQYLSWAGINRQLSYPLSVIPLLPSNSLSTNDTNSSSLMFYISDRDWGLVTIYSNYALWSGILDILVTPRTDPTGGFNSSPRSTITAIVVMFPRCGGWNFTIPTSDPDGDTVQCSWSGTGWSSYCAQQSQIGYPGGYPFTLSSNCVLTYTGGLVTSSVFYSICIQMEDYYVSDLANYEAEFIANNGTNVTLPTPLSSAPLQFIVEISPNITSPCVLVSPLFSDPCILSCTQSISSVVPQSIVPSSYSNSINSTVYLNCSNGYYANPSNLSVTCVQTSTTTAQWIVNGLCFSM